VAMAHPDPVHCRSWWATPAWVAVGTAVCYAALLGWDRRNTRGSDGYAHAPYDNWQVVILIVAMAALGVWAGLRYRVWLSTFAATAVMTVLWSMDAASFTPNDGLWPIGAVAVLSGTGLGFFVVAGLSTRLRLSRGGQRAAV
jgi:hypothetical protein